MYISILYSSLCYAITTPNAGLIILFLKIQKKGRLKRQRHSKSFCLDYHSTTSIWSSNLTFLSSMKASTSINRDMKQGMQDSYPNTLMAKIAIRGLIMKSSSPITCQNFKRLLYNCLGMGTLVTNCILLPFGSYQNTYGCKSFLVHQAFLILYKKDFMRSTFFLLMGYFYFQSLLTSRGYFSKYILVGCLELRQDLKYSVSLRMNLIIYVAIRNYWKIGDSSPYFEKMRNSARNWRVLKFCKESPFLRISLKLGEPNGFIGKIIMTSLYQVNIIAFTRCQTLSKSLMLC